ncbi:tetratricopeptide repeat protein [Kiloniella antarctica]|uniref:protein O-GlcNAc transferase n=1 Tax=Kiloniella antarctica TaxID=1550907 RepID=A0ABW5BPB7_9PROT
MKLKQKKISKDDFRLDELLRLMTLGKYPEVVTACLERQKTKKNSAVDYVLGHALFRLGDIEKGCQSIERARFKSVKDPYCLYRMGHLSFETGHLEQAAICFKKAASIDGTFWEALFNLGNTLKRQFKYHEAIKYYQKVMKLNTEFFDVFFNAGQVYETLKDFKNAQECYEKVISQNSRDVDALCGLGRCYYNNNEKILARNFWDKAIEINPKCAAAYNDIVSTLIQEGDLDTAQSHLDAAIEAGVQHETIYLNMGRIIYIGSKDRILTQKIFEQGVEKYPRVPELWSALLGLMIDEARYSEAEEILKALFSEGMGIWYLKLAMSRLLFETSRLDEAELIMEELLELDPNNHMFISSLLTFKVYNSRHTLEERFRAHKKYGAIIEQSKQGILPTRTYAPQKNKKIKIGYVSPDFRDHATSRFMEPIIANHDRGFFHITLYAQNKSVDDTTRRLQTYADDWCSTSVLDDLQLAKKIQEDEIDILVDLAGHTPGNRLRAFAYKPAPVQVSFVGYPFTTGMKCIDYYIANETLVPEENKKYFIEDVQYLTFENNKIRKSKVLWAPDGVVPNEKSPNLNKGYFTFGCFNRLEKISPKMFEAWVEILKRVPNSRLLLKNRNFDGEGLRCEYINWFVEHGIDQERLDFRGSSDLKGYLSSFNEVDIGLDTYPYNASTVSFDSLAMCVSFVTLQGESTHSRLGALLLRSRGLDYCIAEDYNDYIDKTVELVGKPDVLALQREWHHLRRANEAFDYTVGPIEKLYRKFLSAKSE